MTARRLTRYLAARSNACTPRCQLHHPLYVECRERAEEVPGSREYQRQSVKSVETGGFHQAAWLWRGEARARCRGGRSAKRFEIGD
jgi:hypothetical protein